MPQLEASYEIIHFVAQSNGLRHSHGLNVNITNVSFYLNGHKVVSALVNTMTLTHTFMYFSFKG